MSKNFNLNINDQDDDDENNPKKFDYLNPIYLLRFPFTIKAINWGCGLGAILALNNYFRYRNIKKSINHFFACSFFIGYPIYGFYLAKYIGYNNNIKKLEIEEELKIRKEMFRRNYLIEKMKLDETYTNDEIFNLLEQKIKEEKIHENTLNQLLIHKYDI